MELNELTDKAIDYILDDLVQGNPKLSEWENVFVQSLSRQWKQRRQLTDKQKEILGKIWDKV